MAALHLAINYTNGRATMSALSLLHYTDIDAEDNFLASAS